MTAFDLAMAGYLAFGQPTGNYYESITKLAGLQVIHSDGAVTLRLAPQGQCLRKAESPAEAPLQAQTKTAIIPITSKKAS